MKSERMYMDKMNMLIKIYFKASGKCTVAEYQLL